MPRSLAPPAFLPVVLVAASALLGACTSYEMTITPAPGSLPERPLARRPGLSLEVDSTYAPYVDGQLDLGDVYARDGQLGLVEGRVYRNAFESTRQFAAVQTGQAGSSLHCRLAIVSGREPPNELLRTVSILFTFGLLAHHQREIVSLTATVSAPWRAPMDYALEAEIDTRAVSADASGPRRLFYEPEQQIVDALVARLAADGWLDGPAGEQAGAGDGGR
jgi:hypothetical protein